MAKRSTAKTPRPTKNGRKTSPRPARAKAPPAGPPEGVRVRMYRQGLGDCFLLTFPRPAGGPFHLLIDCGLISGVTPRRPTIMQEVAQDIARETGNHLHAVVATHEHWDHLSGFLQARDIFDPITIDEVWLAWTEDPGDELASRLREGHRRALSGLRAVSEHLQRPAAAGPLSERLQGLAQRLDGLLGFFGAGPTQTTRAALDYLKQHPSHPKVRYHRPGDPPLALPGAPGVRVFVLGPPHDEKLIKRINPTKTGHEVYELAGLDPDVAFLAAFGGLGASADANQRLEDLCQAFDPLFRRPRGTAGSSAIDALYAGEKWRQIDEDWVETADELALNLDSDTNNTSLALAFELRPGGGVLLFPGDAQVGNWLSWEQCSWPADGAKGPPITAADLLKRTVFYKVGHHASHNATLRAKGLELMESPDLVAMIPVDHAMAVKKRWPGMPFPSLLARLEEKAHGRVLRIDDGVPQKQPKWASAAEWKAFQASVREEELLIDYTVTP
jgi:hypothetical protein